ncbi:MAG: hypothetical protein EBE86_035350 [Hormoscilla sp. GUM202]|nr:hypothetical protein [Hormoscilla sp. GUM202]
MSRIRIEGEISLDGSHHPDRANTTSFSRKPIFPDCGGLSRIRIEGEISLDGSHHPDRANTTSFSRKPIFPDCGGLSRIRIEGGKKPLAYILPDID